MSENGPFSERFKALCLLTILISVISPFVCAAGRTVTITDPVGLGWTDELVHYEFDFKKGALPGKARARVRTDRKTILSQVSNIVRYKKDGSVKSFSVWFMADVPAGGESTYEITPGKKGKTSDDVAVRREKGSILLMARRFGKMGIRLPDSDQTFDWPVPAGEVSGPVQALIMPSGRELGEGKLQVPFLVKSYKTEVIADGPLFAEAQITYVFDAGHWVFRARVQKGLPMIIIKEELNTGFNPQKWDSIDRVYSLVLNTGGFKPTEGWYYGRTDKEEYHDLLKNQLQDAVLKGGKHVMRGINSQVSGYTLKLHRKATNYYLSPTFTWSARVGSFIRFVEPGGEAIAFSSLNLAYWRNPLSIRFGTTEEGQLTADFPLQVFKQSWISEGFGRGSPNATGKTLYVPENTARRSYGIMMTPAEDEREEKLYSVIHAAAKISFQPLDRVKDWILDWPDPMKDAAWTEEPTEEGKKAVELMRTYAKLKKDMGNHALYSMWAHRTLTHIRYPIIAPVINSPGDITASQRNELRRLCTFQAYCHNELEEFPWGVGCHLGNPNMSIMAVNARAKSAALIKDHPMFSTWGRWTLSFMKDYIRRYTRETGAPYENVHYTTGVTMLEIAEVNEVLMEEGIGDALDTELFRKCMRFIFDWLTPPELRWNGHRVFLPLGNGAAYPSMPPKFGKLMTEYFKESHPQLAGQFQWASNVTLPEDKKIRIVKDIRPELGSVHHKDYGVFMRHGFGTPYETLFFIMAGNCDGHYEWETGQMDYTLYAKGHPINISFGNGYHPMFIRPWLRNRVSFDHKYEITERNLTQVETASFSPEAEYVHASRTVDQLRSILTEYPILTKNGLSWAPEESKSWKPDLEIEEIPKVEWSRQVLFMKDKDPKGPNYFVLRDSFDGIPTRPTDLSFWFLANKMEKKENFYHFDGQIKVDMDVFVATPQNVTPETGTYGHKAWPYGRLTGYDKKYFPGGKRREDQLFLRLKQPVGQGYMVVLYPRLKDADPAAKFTRLTENAVKVETTLSTDYAFLFPYEFSYHDDKVEFKGMAACVRFYKSGGIVINNSDGPATFKVAGKVIKGSGGFTIAIENNKASTVWKDEQAEVVVE